MRRGHRPRRQLASLSIRWATAREPCLHPKGWCPLRAQWHGERSASLESLAVRVARDLRRPIACLRLPEPPDLSLPASRLHSVVSGARELALLWGMISGACARLPVSVAPLLQSAPQAPQRSGFWLPRSCSHAPVRGGLRHRLGARAERASRTALAASEAVTPRGLPTELRESSCFLGKARAPPDSRRGTSKAANRCAWSDWSLRLGRVGRAGRMKRDVRGE